MSGASENHHDVTQPALSGPPVVARFPAYLFVPSPQKVRVTGGWEGWDCGERGSRSLRRGPARRRGRGRRATGPAMIERFFFEFSAARHPVFRLSRGREIGMPSGTSQRKTKVFRTTISVNGAAASPIRKTPRGERGEGPVPSLMSLFCFARDSEEFSLISPGRSAKRYLNLFNPPPTLGLPSRHVSSQHHTTSRQHGIYCRPQAAEAAFGRRAAAPAEA